MRLLTHRERKIRRRVFDKWREVVTRTEPTNRPKAEELISKIYKKAGKEPPKFIWGESPHELRTKYSVLRHSHWDGFRGCAWIAFADFGREAVGHNFLTEEEAADLELQMEIAREIFMFWTYERVCFVSERPSVIKTEFQDDVHIRLHCMDGPAMQFRDGWSLYCVRGVLVAKAVVEGTFTINEVLSEPNTEVQRVMIERYQADRFLRDSEAELVNEDEYGKLYRIHLKQDHRVGMPDEEPLMIVQVQDATPLPEHQWRDYGNGMEKYKQYWLAVDPNAYGGLKTAHAAVASTWRNEDGSLYFKNPEDYHPDIET